MPAAPIAHAALTLVLATTAVAGCDAASGRPGEGDRVREGDAKADGFDEFSSDVEVLSAVVGGAQRDALAQLDPGDCVRLEDGLMDCTEALEIMTERPSLHSVVVDRNDGEFSCHLLVVQTVSRTKAADTADGIGFFYEGYGSDEAHEQHFVDWDNLVSVDEVTLADGTPGTVHEFVGLARCWLGSKEESDAATYAFKPFLGVVDDDGEMTRNWDDAKNAYTVGGGLLEIDRSAEVLDGQ